MTPVLPDFIVIGAMKCATSTLHEQLALQPGITMSEPKEPCFFSNDEVFQRGLEWYGKCFPVDSSTRLVGESSTHYTKLPTYPHTVERLRKHVPNAKFIYVMRHPIDRLVSHYIHDWSERVITCPIDEAIDKHPTLIEYSRYARQLESFFEAFGFDRVLPVFFDRLHRSHQTELERICRFIGYTGTPCWQVEHDQTNVSSTRMKKSRIRDAIVFAPGLSAIRRSLIPKSWRDRVKRLWTMSERPQLSDTSVERVRSVFDEDLVQLGRWLGRSLSCATFKQVTSAATLDWQIASEAALA